MDIAQLAEQEAQFSAQIAEILKGREPTPADLQRPLDLQQKQLARVTDRIQALEDEKAASASRIDAEIAELKGELDRRQRAIEAQREGLKSAMIAAGAARPTEEASAPVATKEGSPATAAARPEAKRAKP